MSNILNLPSNCQILKFNRKCIFIPCYHSFGIVLQNEVHILKLKLDLDLKRIMCNLPNKNVD